MIAKKMACPGCGEPAELAASNAFRPFCCERCRLLDLGNWLDERYKFSDPESEGADFGFMPDD